MKAVFICIKSIALCIILLFSLFMNACNLGNREKCISCDDMYEVYFEFQPDTSFSKNYFFIIENKEDMKKAQIEYKQLYDLPYFEELIRAYSFEKYTLIIELIKSEHVASLSQKQIRIDTRTDTMYSDILYENNDDILVKYWAVYWIVEKNKLSDYDFSEQKIELYPLGKNIDEFDKSRKIAEDIKEGRFVISDSAIRYEFDSYNNLLRYKSVIVDKDFIIYVFEKYSDLVGIIQKYDDLKVWLEFYNNPLNIKFDAEWDFVEYGYDCFLIIYCDTASYDFDKGVGLSNSFKKDGQTYYSWTEKKDTIDVTISGIEYPLLVIHSDNGPYRYSQRYTEEKIWSEVYSFDYINWDP